MFEEGRYIALQLSTIVWVVVARLISSGHHGNERAGMVYCGDGVCVCVEDFEVLFTYSNSCQCFQGFYQSKVVLYFKGIL